MANLVKKHSTAFSICVFFLFFLLIFLLSPLTIDDTYYQYLNFNSLKEVFNFAAGYGNGRILGNMMGIILAKSTVLSAFVRSAIFTSMLFLIYQITKTGNKIADKLIISVAIISFVGMNAELFGKAFSWQSAFCNTAPPVLLLLLSIFLIKKYNSLENKPILTLTAICVCAFCEQFFSENSTVYNIVFYFALIFINIIFEKKKNAPYVLSFIFSALGGLGMLLCRMFYPLVSRDLISVKKYQQLHLGSISEILKSCFYNGETCSVHLLKFIIIFSILSAELFVLFSKREFKNSKCNKLMPVFKFSVILFPLYGLLRLRFYPNFYFEGLFRIIHLLLLFLVVFMYIVALIAAAFLIKDKNVKLHYSVYMCFAIFTVAPLLVISPLEIRTLAYAYIFVVFSEIILISEVLKLVSKNSIENMNKILSGTTIGIGIYVLSVFISISAMSKNVETYCRKQMEKGSTEIIVCDLSNTDYYYYVNPDSTYKFLFYYSTPGDIEFSDVDSYEWRINYFEKNAD